MAVEYDNDDDKIWYRVYNQPKPIVMSKATQKNLRLYTWSLVCGTICNIKKS